MVTYFYVTIICIFSVTVVTIAVMNHEEHSNLIDKLGGSGKVADIFGISSQAVSKWRNEGIPDGRMMYLRLVYPDVFGVVACNKFNGKTRD